MDKELWKKIEEYSLDEAGAEYSFSVRLAHENKWTLYFTKQAIIEYKKFMYLAAISEQMVSPSPIVDVVWHQHLIYTKSYNEFAKILNKKIEHIPSTHNSDLQYKFVQAKAHTKKVYKENFGEQPKEFWEYSSINDSFEMEESKVNLQNYVLIGIAAFVILIFPFSMLLKPLLININNPYFLYGYIFLIIGTFIGLSAYTNTTYKKAALDLLKKPVFSGLRASELIYIQKTSIEEVIHCIVNKLVVNHSLNITKDYKLEPGKKLPAKTIAEEIILAKIEKEHPLYYPALIQDIAAKQCFLNYKNAAVLLDECFRKSKTFVKVYLTSFFALMFMFAIGCSRLIIGISRDKPVAFLVIVLCLFLLIAFFFVKKRFILFTKKTVPLIFKVNATVISKENQQFKDLEWQYFIVGAGVMALSFKPLASYVDRNKDNSNGGSSCGSSCGSSGGDGGGGDGGGGGCGGCGGGGD